MKKQYHVISAKNFGYESVLGDGTYDYFVFPASEYSKSEATVIEAPEGSVIHIPLGNGLMLAEIEWQK
jgi:hypothetical protein